METTTKYFVAELVNELGSLPTLAAQVVNMTADPLCDLTDLSKVILSDNVLSMRFLALANSAAVGHGHEVKDLRSALVRLGIRRVRNVTLLMGIHDMAPNTQPDVDLNLTEHWKHTLAVASCAQGLAWQRGKASHDDAWLVGILHGVGVSALTQRTGTDFNQVVKFARDRQVVLAEAEMQVLDFHHGELGARILKSWNLPRLFRDVIEYYPEDFEADELSSTTVELIDILRDAITIARTIGYGSNGDFDALTPVSELAQELQLEQPSLEALAAKVDREVLDMSDLIGLDMPEELFAKALQASQQEVARVGLEGFADSLIKEDLEAQMSAAREIQQRILPHDTPTIPGYELSAVNYPSKAVSGDTYDFITLKGGAQGFVIADVSGKGIPAALLASTLQASIRALALVIDDPGELLSAANHALFNSTDPERFATIFIAVLEPDGSGLRYASGGHNPPLVLRTDGTEEWLPPAGTPLGMLPEMNYPVTKVTMATGDMIVAYTDGITEAVDDLDVEFEEKGLADVVNKYAHAGPAKIISETIAAVHLHVSRKTVLDEGLVPSRRANFGTTDEIPDAGDDLTMIVMRKI